jgi:pimeloyl-ACP methyl ester carboxylesterase
MLETEDVSSAPTGGDTWTVFRHVVNATRPRRIQTASEPREPGVEKLLLKPEGVVGPVAALSVRGGDVRQSTVVVVAPEGKDVCLVDEPLVQALLQGGYAVILLDAFGTGESVTFAREEERHFLTFNRTDLANRVQDVVTTTTHALGSAKAVDLVGVRQSGLWALLARPYLPDVRVTVCDMGNTNYDDDEAFTGEDRLPGVRQFGGVAGAGTLIAPGVLHLHGLAAGWDLTPLRRAYDATGSGRHLSTSQSAASTDEILARLR